MKNTIKIDDPDILDMDPVHKMWMFQNWIADQNDDAELAKNHAYLLGSFTNPEAVKQLMGTGNVFESSEEELDESSQMVKEGFTLQLPTMQADSTVKRRPRILKE